MPIFIVGKKVLNTRLQCIVTPIKVSRLYLNEDVSAEIYSKAGDGEIQYLFDKANPLSFAVPFMTSGLALSDQMIHIIVSDMTLCPNFQTDMYVSYNDIFKLIVDNGFTSVVLPPLIFSYKRLGNKNSYRTCVTFVKYFMDLYKIDCNIYIMSDRRTITDHVTNYVSTYVSTSYPLSKRHKPTKYPLNNSEDLKEYLKEAGTLAKVHESIKRESNFNFEFKNTKYQEIYTMIKNTYPDDYSFCFEANISKLEYKKFLEEDNYTPSKYTLIGMCLALRLDIKQTNDILNKYLNTELNIENDADKLIISYIEAQKYDILNINEELFLISDVQVGSYYPACEVYKQ